MSDVASALGSAAWRSERRRSRLPDVRLVVGLGLSVALCLVAVFAPLLAAHDPTEQDVLRSLTPPSWMPGGRAGYLLGTDQLGRDLFARVLYGARVSLAVGLLAVACSAPVGVLIGALSGYVGGWFDDLMMRIADAQLSLPALLLAIAVIGVIGPSVASVIIVIGLSQWVVYARVVRSEVFSLKDREFVQAARAVGAPARRVLLRHVLPNALVPVTVIATFAVGNVILVESSLSFLGFGVPPPTPTWGGMVGQGRDYLAQAWWLSVFPSLAIALTVLAVNFLGDWLRDRLDPRRRR